MKKCDNCGAVQSDDRTVCIDCGNYLDKPLTDAEEAKAEAEIDAAVEHSLDPTDNFTVPRRDKIMGGIALSGIMLMVILLCISGYRWNLYQPNYPDVHILHESVDGIFYFTETSEMPQFIANPYADEQHALERASTAAFGAVLLFAVSAAAFFFPRLMWLWDTAHARRYAWGELTPTRWWIVTNRVTQYGAFSAGWLLAVVAIIYIF